jgi:hypothetical protein
MSRRFVASNPAPHSSNVIGSSASRARVWVDTMTQTRDLQSPFRGFGGEGSNVDLYRATLQLQSAR